MSSFCKNCKHFSNNHPLTLEFGSCRFTANVKLKRMDLVSGNVTPEKTIYPYASSERAFGACGKDGLNYEHEDSVFKRIVNQQRGTALWAMYFTTYLGLLLLVSIIVHEI